MASSEQTTKRHLNKPQPEDFVNVINDICDNMDNLDDAVPDSRKVNGHALNGDITVSKSDVGLGNVDNTSDANKPLSNADKAVTAKDYANLTFPVAAGTHCIHDNKYYVANQNIQSSESWTAAHWTQTTIGDESASLKSALKQENSYTDKLNSDISPFTGKRRMCPLFDYGEYDGTRIKGSTKIIVSDVMPAGIYTFEILSGSGQYSVWNYVEGGTGTVRYSFAVATRENKEMTGAFVVMLRIGDGSTVITGNDMVDLVKNMSITSSSNNVIQEIQEDIGRIDDDVNDIKEELLNIGLNSADINEISVDISPYLGKKKIYNLFNYGEYTGSTFLTSKTKIYTILPAGHYITSIKSGDGLYSIWSYNPNDGTGSEIYSFSNSTRDRTYETSIAIMLRIGAGTTEFDQSNYSQYISMLSISQTVTKEYYKQSLFKLGNIDSNFVSPFEFAYSGGDLGADGTKYTFKLPLKDRFNIRYKFKLTQDLFSASVSPSKEFMKLNNNSSEITYNRFTQKTASYTYGGQSKTSYYPVFTGGVSLLTSGSAARDDYNPYRGSIAFGIQYTGNENTAKISCDGAKFTVVIGSQQSDFVFSQYETTRSLINALNAMSDITVTPYETENRNCTELIKFPDFTLTSTFLIDEQEVTDKAIAFVPYAMSYKWHQVEAVGMGDKIVVCVDGIVKQYSYTPSDDYVEMILNRQNIGMQFADLEIDIQTVRDAEFVNSELNENTIISEVNPYFIVYEGHGMEDKMTSDVEEELSCSYDRIQYVQDMLKSKGYIPVTIFDIIEYLKNGKNIPKRSYTMIFDDYRFDNVLDLRNRASFTRNSAKCALAVITNRNDAITFNGEMITIEKAIEICKNNGFECVSHTKNHTNLLSIKPSEIMNELTQCVYNADEKGVHSNVLVYPFGATNRYVMSCLEARGLSGGVNVQYHARIARATNVYNIPRREIGVREATSDMLAEIL